LRFSSAQPGGAARDPSRFFNPKLGPGHGKNKDFGQSAAHGFVRGKRRNGVAALPSRHGCVTATQALDRAAAP